LLEKFEDLDVDKDLYDVHIVLSGSGLKMFAFLLAIWVLHLCGYRFIRATGTSGGAMVAALLASVYDPSSSRKDRGLAIRSMIMTAMRINIPELLDPRWRFWRLLWSLGGIIKGDRILACLRQELPSTFQALRMPCLITTFQVNQEDPGTKILWTGDLPLAVRASMSIPGIFDPVRYGNRLLVDGGWQMNLAIPADGKDVLALTFGTGDDTSIIEIKNNMQLFIKLLDGAIDEGMRRAIAAAPKAKVISLSAPSLSGLDFFMTEDEKVQGMLEGGESVKEWLTDEHETSWSSHEASKEEKSSCNH